MYFKVLPNKTYVLNSPTKMKKIVDWIKEKVHLHAFHERICQCKEHTIKKLHANSNQNKAERTMSMSDKNIIY